ncbi:MAG: ATP-dependent sacrificial sulfur transferase LarE [Desulfobacteraceae bacterium]
MDKPNGEMKMDTVEKVKKSQVDEKAVAGRLHDYFSKFSGAIIAYSGGVDSALLAYAAHRAMGEHMVAAIADSPSLARREYRSAVSFAQEHGIPLQIVRTDEMKNPFYQANAGNRCYYCKKALFEKLDELRDQLEDARPQTSWPILYGVNMDDLTDHRPGAQAAEEADVKAPFTDLGIDKKTIRSLCAYYGLEIAEKPAMPCMSSRIQYGEKVTEEKLSQVEQAEDFLYDLGFRILRVRHHGDTARIEVMPQDFDKLLELREAILERFQDIGFIYISMDLKGFKSGSLNAALEDK